MFSWNNNKIEKNKRKEEKKKSKFFDYVMGLENLVGRKSQLYVVSSAIHLVSLKSSGRGRAKEAKDVHRSSCMYRGKGT